MEVRDFCNSVGSELTDIKAKMYDVIAFVEKLPVIEKERFKYQVKDLRTSIDGIDRRLNQLSAECPVDWGPAAEEIRRSVEELRARMGDIWDKEHIAGGYVGG